MSTSNPEDEDRYEYRVYLVRAIGWDLGEEWELRIPYPPPPKVMRLAPVLFRPSYRFVRGKRTETRIPFTASQMRDAQRNQRDWIRISEDRPHNTREATALQAMRAHLRQDAKLEARAFRHSRPIDHRTHPLDAGPFNVFERMRTLETWIGLAASATELSALVSHCGGKLPDNAIEVWKTQRDRLKDLLEKNGYGFSSKRQLVVKPGPAGGRPRLAIRAFAADLIAMWRHRWDGHAAFAGNTPELRAAFLESLGDRVDGTTIAKANEWLSDRVRQSTEPPEEAEGDRRSPKLPNG